MEVLIYASTGYELHLILFCRYSHWNNNHGCYFQDGFKQKSTKRKQNLLFRSKRNPVEEKLDDIKNKFDQKWEIKEGFAEMKGEIRN